MRTLYIELQVQVDEDFTSDDLVRVIKWVLDKALLLKSVRQLPMEDSVE